MQEKTKNTQFGLKEINLGILSRASFKNNGTEAFFQNTDGPYLDGVALGVKQIILMASVIRKGIHTFYDRWPNYSYQFTSKNIITVELPWSTNYNPGMIETARLLLQNIPVMWRAVQASDVIGIFMPGMRSVIASLICRLQKKPYWVYLGSDWAGNAHLTFRWGGLRRRLFLPIYMKCVNFLARQVMKPALFRLVTGRVLWKKYQYGDNATYETRPLVTLSGDQFYHREDTCLSDTVRLLYVANLHPRKGHRFLIEAVALLLEAGIPCELILVGDGRERDNLATLIHHLGLQNSVCFKGYLLNGPELWEQYRAADIFVLPSLGEGLPRVIFEAMAHSLPVICSDVSGLSDHFTHEEQIFFVPPAQPREIANAIITLKTKPQLRRMLIANGYKYAEGIMRETAAEQTLRLMQQHLPAGANQTTASKRI